MVATSYLVPNPGESQPDFAIRFHESMRDSVPRTSERNALMFRAWEEHVGDRDPLRRIAAE